MAKGKNREKVWMVLTLMSPVILSFGKANSEAISTPSRGQVDSSARAKRTLHRTQTGPKIEQAQSIVMAYLVLLRMHTEYSAGTARRISVLTDVSCVFFVDQRRRASVLWESIDTTEVGLQILISNDDYLKLAMCAPVLMCPIVALGVHRSRSRTQCDALGQSVAS